MLCLRLSFAVRSMLDWLKSIPVTRALGQRNANFATRTLLNVDNQTPVAISIDPFFFRVVN